MDDGHLQARQAALLITQPNRTDQPDKSTQPLSFLLLTSCFKLRGLTTALRPSAPATCGAASCGLPSSATLVHHRPPKNQLRCQRGIIHRHRGQQRMHFRAEHHHGPRKPIVPPDLLQPHFVQARLSQVAPYAPLLAAAPAGPLPDVLVAAFAVGHGSSMTACHICGYGPTDVFAPRLLEPKLR